MSYMRFEPRWTPTSALILSGLTSRVLSAYQIAQIQPDYARSLMFKGASTPSGTVLVNFINQWGVKDSETITIANTNDIQMSKVVKPGGILSVVITMSSGTVGICLGTRFALYDTPTGRYQKVDDWRQVRMVHDGTNNATVQGSTAGTAGYVSAANDAVLVAAMTYNPTAATDAAKLFVAFDPTLTKEWDRS